VLGGLRPEQADKDRESLLQGQIIAESGKILSAQRLVSRFSIFRNVVRRSVPPSSGKYLAKYLYNKRIFSTLWNADTGALYFNPSTVFKPSRYDFALPDYTTLEESKL
jgi:hypothetical protein